jgi:hypothetical protein
MINYFDIGIIALTITADYLIYRRFRLQKFHIAAVLLVAFIFFYVFPYISVTIELKKNAIKYPDSDGFNNFYIVLKWPLWWLIGIGEIVTLFLIAKTNKNMLADKKLT